MSQLVNITEMQERAHRFMTDRGWEAFHNLKNLAMALSIESAELMEIIQWMNNPDAETIKNHPKKLEQIREEIGDVFHVLLRICLLLDIDLVAAFYDKIEKTEAKYPIELCKGRYDKYNELQESPPKDC